MRSHLRTRHAHSLASSSVQPLVPSLEAYITPMAPHELSVKLKVLVGIGQYHHQGASRHKVAMPAAGSKMTGLKSESLTGFIPES